MMQLLRILAVDNEPSVTLSLRFALGGGHHEVTTVASSAEALHKLDTEQEQFDIIIVDQKMPDMTGLQLVSALKERRVPSKIIVLSAQLTSELRAAFDRLGVEFILTKPFDLAEMRQAVGSLAA